MADETGNAALAERFYRAIERRDYAGVEACYTPDAQLWHNIAGKTQTVAENLAEIRIFPGSGAQVRRVIVFLENRIDQVSLGREKEDVVINTPLFDCATANAPTNF